MENVQFGCGLCAPDNWANFDSSPSLRLQRLPLIGHFVPGQRFPSNVRYGDILKGLPVGEGSVHLIYCSHVLEHLSLSDFRLALRNTYRCLKAGGTFRFVLPDLRVFAIEYVASHDPNAATTFIERLGMGERQRARGLQLIR
jgi:hypothetical protein